LTFSYSNHSAWNSISNCSLQQCYGSSINNNSCLLSLTPCFNYRTFNNISYCAPGILCSILELCDNMTNTCTSNTSVCIVNSCCSSQPICFPLSSTNLCMLGNDTFYSSLCVFRNWLEHFVSNLFETWFILIKVTIKQLFHAAEVINDTLPNIDWRNHQTNSKHGKNV
jgi:hypothetical protein